MTSFLGQHVANSVLKHEDKKPCDTMYLEYPLDNERNSQAA